MITILAGIIMLGILVFVHELGHFCVAKWAGVKVLKFSLGFGPKLVSRTWGETEYLICAVPLGGYVQMLGEGGGENGEEAELTAAEKQRSFADKPVSARTAIVAAGPLMNLIFPFLIMPIAYLVGVQLPAFLEQPPCVGYVANDSDASRSGFLPGDCIEQINGDPVATWNDANLALLAHAGSPLQIEGRRDGQALALTFTPANGGLEGLRSIGLFPRQEAVVGGLAPGMPASAAGLEVGDLIRAIGNVPISSWYDLKQVIQAGQGTAMTVHVERAGKPLALTLTPVREDGKGSEYLIGIAPAQETIFKRFGLVESIKAGGKRTIELIKLTLVFIQKLVAGQVSSKNIGGPITVVQIAGQAAQTDLSSILSVLAFLSIQLGILNLFPIPILDGGHLFFNLFEAVLRRPLSLRTREIAQQIGLALLVMLMVLAFYNDIVRLLFGGQ